MPKRPRFMCFDVLSNETPAFFDESWEVRAARDVDSDDEIADAKAAAPAAKKRAQFDPTSLGDRDRKILQAVCELRDALKLGDDAYQKIVNMLKELDLCDLPSKRKCKAFRDVLNNVLGAEFETARSL